MRELCDLPAGLSCSTPFGITEVGTRVEGSERDDLRAVLNAFRHH